MEIERFLLQTDQLLADIGCLRADRINLRIQLVRIMR